jgi:hypothetical protein
MPISKPSSPSWKRKKASAPKALPVWPKKGSRNVCAATTRDAPPTMRSTTVCVRRCRRSSRICSTASGAACCARWPSGVDEAAVDFRQALVTADELIWSVQPKSDPGRAAQAGAGAARPAATAQSGIRQRRSASGRQAAHAQRPVRLHAQWIKPGAAPAAPPPVRQWVPGGRLGQRRGARAEVVTEHVEQDGLEFEDISLNLPAHLDLAESDRVTT